MTGYLISPRALIVLTASIASTAMFAKKASSLLHTERNEFNEIEEGEPISENSRSDNFTRHAGLGDVDQALLSKCINLDTELFRQVSNCLLRCESVTGNDGRRVNLVLDEIVRSLQEFGSDDDDRGSTISNFLVLLLSEFYEDPSRWVFNFDQLKNRSSVIRDCNILRSEPSMSADRLRTLQVVQDRFSKEREG